MASNSTRKLTHNQHGEQDEPRDDRERQYGVESSKQNNPMLPASSRVLSAMLLKGSGEALTARRVAASTAPAGMRMKVRTASHAESMAGILSAVSATKNSKTAITMTSVQGPASYPGGWQIQSAGADPA